MNIFNSLGNEFPHESIEIVDFENKIFNVWKSIQNPNEYRQVDIVKGTCTCSSWNKTRIPCWHMFSCFNNTHCTYDDLPLNVRDAPHMRLDINNNNDGTIDVKIDGDNTNSVSNVNANNNSNIDSLDWAVAISKIRQSRIKLSRCISKMSEWIDLSYALNGDDIIEMDDDGHFDTIINFLSNQLDVVLAKFPNVCGLREILPKQHKNMTNTQKKNKNVNVPQLPIPKKNNNKNEANKIRALNRKQKKNEEMRPLMDEDAETYQRNDTALAIQSAREEISEKKNDKDYKTKVKCNKIKKK
eukprot:294042_1